MSERKAVIAKAIFAWLNGPEVVSDRWQSQPPFTHNPNAELLRIDIDGLLDCNVLAEAIDVALTGRG